MKPLNLKEAKKVTGYEEACKRLKMEPLTIEDFKIFPEEDRKRYFARHQLTICIRALVGNYKPDFRDGEYKFYNYFYTEGKTGFGSVVDLNYIISTAGSDLYYPTHELAEVGRVNFRQLYIDYLF